MSGQPLEGDVDCSEVALRIFEYLDGELGQDDMLRFAAHLRHCGQCLHEQEIDRTLKSIVRRSHHVESAPSSLRAAIITTITTVSIRRTTQF